MMDFKAEEKDMSLDDQIFCENFLTKAGVMRELSREDITEERLAKLLTYEISTRRRYRVIDRLLGRKNKLRRQRELKETFDYIREAYGERY